MLCPKDVVPCIQHAIGPVKMDVCNQCGGVWIEAGEVRELLHAVAQPDTSDIDERFGRWQISMHNGTEPDEFWSESLITCPIDHTRLKKHYFAGTTVGVDQCPACDRFWLDQGELQAMVSEVEPNYQDIIAAALFKEKQAFDRFHENAKKLNQQLHALPVTAMQIAASPYYAVLLVVRWLTKKLLEEAKNQT